MAKSKRIGYFDILYKVTKHFPSEEKYGLSSQLRRASVSIPSNIAEGKLRNSDQEFRKFSLIAFGSGGEMETQIEIAKELENFDHIDFSSVESLLEEIIKMLNTMIGNRS